MQRFLVALLVTVFVPGLGKSVPADDTDVTAILGKAMNALGGEDTLRKVKAATWKTKGKISFGDKEEYEFTGQMTAQGLDRFRSELVIDLLDEKLKQSGVKKEDFGAGMRILAVLNGDKAWYTALDFPRQADAALLKRAVYLAVIPVTLAPLKGPGFKVEAAGEEKVGGQPAVVLKVTCPDGKDIKVSFDKESGLPVKAVGKVFTLEDEEVTQETTYSNYKDFGGVKIATRLEVKSDGGIFDRKQEVTEFKVLDKVDPLAFSAQEEAAGLAREERAVPGPETDKLLPSTTGYVLFAFGSDQPDGIAVGDIVAVQLPTLKDTIVRPTAPENQIDMPTIHALSGPDAEGRIAYIEDHFFVADEKTRRHLLKTIRLDGTKDTEVFSRPGSAMWATTSVGRGEIGHDLALSPVGGRVAFLSGLVNAQMPSATCLLSIGTVEVWDVDNKTRNNTSFKALDAGRAWLHDGKRMAYVKLVEPKATAPADPPTDSFGKTFNGWEKVPAVFIRDVDAQTETFLHLGWHPVVSSDGQSVLVRDLENAWKRVDVATGRSSTATWPGLWRPVASPTKDVVLSLCLPTKGAKVRFTEHNSPVVGPKEMLSLKLARLNANEFQTVVPYIDPRMRVSFGQVRQKSEK